MERARAKQTLSYPLRLPDAAQADVLRLLDASREVINAALASLWPVLDAFGERGDGPAYKQVEALMASPKPQTEQRQMSKNRQAIRAALKTLRELSEDGGKAVELQGLVEQACNYFLTHGNFPETYEQMQPIPVLKAGQLPYAGDDGPGMGQAYRSPDDREKAQDWGAWLWCEKCHWNGARDYAAALNIARLGATFITHALSTGAFVHPFILEQTVNPVSYRGTGPVLRLPPTVPRERLLHAGKMYCNGWRNSVTLRSSYPTEFMLRLCG